MADESWKSREELIQALEEMRADRDAIRTMLEDMITEDAVYPCQYCGMVTVKQRKR